MKIISMKGLVEKAHGKICQDDNNSVSYRKKDGKMFSSRRCNERDLDKKPYSERELEIQSDFTETSQIAAAWTKANRVYKANSRTIDLDNCTEDYKKMRAAFDAQDKIVTFQAFVWAQIQNGAVVVPDVEVTGGGSPSAGSGTGTTKYTLSLSASPTAGGTVTGAGQYNSGASATINAVANSGYTFTRWSDGVTSASRSVVMSANKTLSAIFTSTAGGGENPEGGDGEENNLH